MGVILIAEDEWVFIDIYKRMLSGTDMTIETARNTDELEEQYLAHRDDIVGIILDGCLSEHKPNTIPFIHKTVADRKAGLFSGFVVASSVDPDVRRTMSREGCTHESEKSGAARLLLALLNSLGK